MHAFRTLFSHQMQVLNIFLDNKKQTDDRISPTHARLALLFKVLHVKGVLLLGYKYRVRR